VAFFEHDRQVEPVDGDLAAHHDGDKPHREFHAEIEEG
jgi:hypothetical protein